MSKTVTFGMFWQMYGQCTVDLPDDIDEKDGKAVLKFIRDKWDDFPLPEGSYVQCSDELDESAEITVDPDDGDTIYLGTPDDIMDN